MHLIIGLGNPGIRYHNTRHNIGFMMLDFIAEKYHASFTLEKKYNAETARVIIGERDALLIKPQTSMNLSGKSVRQLHDFYDIQLGSLIAIHDDLDIAFGSWKISFDKNPAGHHGIESIIEAIDSRAFWRIRLGIADQKLLELRSITNLDQRHAQIAEFVLSAFDASEQAHLAETFEKALLELEEKVI